MTATSFATPSLLRRCAAMIYDSLLLMATSVLYGAIVVGVSLIIQGAPSIGDRIDLGIMTIPVFLGWIATLVYFLCFFWHKSGQTLGMKTWRIKIVSASGGLPSYNQCLLRCLGGLLSLLCLGGGYWWIYIDAERQTWHDHVSNTRTLLLPKIDKSR